MANEIDELRVIARELETQDNDCTDEPYFFVQEKRRDYGYDPDYSDHVVWLDCDSEEVGADEAEVLGRRYEDGEEVDGDWTRTGYVDRWETVQACLTRRGAEAYIKANGHNHGPLRIYTQSAYRNEEIQLLRRLVPVAAEAIEHATDAELRAVQRERDEAREGLTSAKAALDAAQSWAADLESQLARVNTLGELQSRDVQRLQTAQVRATEDWGKLRAEKAELERENADLRAELAHAKAEGAREALERVTTRCVRAAFDPDGNARTIDLLSMLDDEVTRLAGEESKS